MNALATPMRYQEDLEAEHRALEHDSMDQTMHTAYFQQLALNAVDAFREINEALSTGGFGPIDTLGELEEWTGVRG